jgi:hypothetical protein
MGGQQRLIAVMVRSESNLLFPGTFYMPYPRVASQLLHSIGYALEAPEHHMITFQSMFN